MERNIAEAIRAGKTALGIELGSTRIKAVLIDETHHVLAKGQFTWENRLENGLWTYRLEDAVFGLQQSYAMLAREVQRQFGIELCTIGSIGISGMMHGYLPLDAEGRQLAPFLTWRNTNTGAAADALTNLFQFNIPLRWSIAHLYQAMLDHKPHVEKIHKITTLAGYIHYLLGGEHVVGIGEAAGMFPVDYVRKDFNERMLEQFDTYTAGYGYDRKTRSILPKVMTAGQCAGHLTESGARLLDPSGKLQHGIPLVPPEGDAATGMVATNSVAVGTGNISAGTSIFSMIVLEQELRQYYRDIDIVSTPNGHPVAMIHCNNGTSELDAWMRMFAELLESFGADISTERLYTELFQKSLQGAPDCDGILLYNYISGEPITGSKDGRPLLVRRPDSKLSLANFMRAQIYAAMASLAVGMRILSEENIHITRLTAHGGLFTTPDVAQRYFAAALGTPITVMQNSSEGGPYGMAILALYLQEKERIPLETYLQDLVFHDADSTTSLPDVADAAGAVDYLCAYDNGLEVEHCAVRCVKAVSN